MLSGTVNGNLDGSAAGKGHHMQLAEVTTEENQINTNRNIAVT